MAGWHHPFFECVEHRRLHDRCRQSWVGTIGGSRSSCKPDGVDSQLWTTVIDVISGAKSIRPHSAARNDQITAVAPDLTPPDDVIRADGKGSSDSWHVGHA